MYTIQEIATIIGAEGTFSPALIARLLTDSRRISQPREGLFFALTGPRHDGHAFLGEAYRRGVRHFVVHQALDRDQFPEADLLCTSNTLRALQSLAAHHRRRFDYPVVGITGSNGKTIVKEWLYQLLCEDYHIVRSPRSYNSQIGVPLSLWEMTSEHQLGLFEAGISTTGEMAALARMIRPTIGVFTNLGAAHSEGFPDDETKLHEKIRLFEGANHLVYQKTGTWTDDHLAALSVPAFTWSFDQPADLKVVSVDSDRLKGTRLEVCYQGQYWEAILPFRDAASIENALHCWSCLIVLGVSPEVIPPRLAQLGPIAMRMELREGIRGCTLINDSYNADLTSLDIALRFLDEQTTHDKRTIILSELLQSKARPDQLYRSVAQLIHRYRIQRVIGVGERTALLGSLLNGAVFQHFSHTRQLVEQLHRLEFENESILIKGARNFGLEYVAERLTKKAHQTALEVNLSALAHNLRVYHRGLHHSTKMMVMVKAAAYGSGSIDIARTLQAQKVDYLGVAYADEGVELRQAGIHLPIVVLNPEPGSFPALVEFGLEAELYSLKQANELKQFLEGRGTNLPVHVNLNTGMNRLGFDRSDWPALRSFLNPATLRPASVFTHLAASEDPGQDALTEQQISWFKEGYDFICEGLANRPLKHVLNSHGISRFPQYQMDMVRLGIGIYGIDGSGRLAESLKTVFHLRTTIAQIREVAPGQGIGYGHLDPANQPRRIATVSIGYADGLLRSAGNGAFSMLVQGREAPIVGQVCMDMCMLDVTQIPTAQAGDPVTVFGDDHPVENLARACRTIPYEIFARIAPRVQRIYTKE